MAIKAAATTHTQLQNASATIIATGESDWLLPCNVG